MSLTFLLCVEVFSSPLGTWMVIDLTAKGRFRYGAVIRVEKAVTPWWPLFYLQYFNSGFYSDQ